MSRLNRREAIQAGAVGLGIATVGVPLADAARGMTSSVVGELDSFHYDHILGTSLDVWVSGVSEKELRDLEQTVLDEIERLRLIFSTFDPLSELSKFNRSNGPFAASEELLAVLREYDSQRTESRGACSPALGELVQQWKDAEREGQLPDPAVLRRLADRINLPAWEHGREAGTIVRLHDQILNLNSIAKGYIIRAAANAALRKVPHCRGLLLSLGGDMTAVGDGFEKSVGWEVGVQNPFEPADNARPLTALRLKNQAVATSGGYLRHYTIHGTRYSHLLDPRTGQSANAIASAVVVAPHSVEANALATMLCILTPSEGLQRIASKPDTHCLIIGANGEQWRSPGFAGLETPRPEIEDRFAVNLQADAWPEGYQVAMTVELPRLPGGRYRKPYVAIWIENADGKPVRTLAVWGNSMKYLKDLTVWWKFAKDDSALVRAVTRATKNPGKHDLVWDGKDDKGKPLGQGTYTIKVEVSREHGRHTTQSGKLACEAEATKITLEKNAETGDTTIEYGKKK